MIFSVIISLSQTHRVAWGKFVHSLCWGNFGHPNILLTALNTTHPYNWTFPNCNWHQFHNGSVHKQNNKRVIVTSSVWEHLSYLGSLAICLAKNKTNKKHDSVGCTKSKDRHIVGRSCLFWSSVFATICPLKNLPNFRYFDDVVLNLRIHS